MKKENCNNQMCLDDLRKNIDEIDEKMRRLFIERLNVVKNIAIEKMKKNLPIENIQREKQILEEHLNLVDEEYKDEYLKFLKSILSISKDYQNELFKINNIED